MWFNKLSNLGIRESFEYFLRVLYLNISKQNYTRNVVQVSNVTHGPPVFFI